MRTLLPAAAALALIALAPFPAAAEVAVELPGLTPAGRPIEVTATLDPGVDVAQVELLYRSAATPEIRALLMAALDAGRYRQAIPGEHVVAPGVEVVIRLRDRSGGVRLYFRAAPEQPWLVPVTGAVEVSPAAALIAELVPSPGSAVVGRRPTLVVRLAPEAPPPAAGRVMMTIDGVDVSPQLEIAAREIRLRPASALAPGPHQAVVTFLDGEGAPGAPVAWPFQVRDWPALQEGSLGVAFSGTYEYAMKKGLAADPRWKASANARVEGRLAEGGFAASLGAEFRYLEEDPREPPNIEREVDLASHLLTLLYGRGASQARIDLGEIAVRESMLTTGFSFSRRGGQLSARAAETELRVFSTSAVPLFGIDNVTGLDEPDQRVQGVSLSHGVLGERLRVKLTALEGTNAPPRAFGERALAPAPGQTSQQPLQAYSVGSTQSGFDAYAYSLSASSRLFDGRLRAEAEGAWGRRLLLALTDAAPEPDARGWQSDGAWRGRLEGDLWRVRAGIDYQHVGVDFLSPANPTLVVDREDGGLDLGTTLGYTSWQLRLARGHDNVRDTRGLPRTTERKLTPSVTLGVPGAPTLTLAYLRSDQTTERAATGQPRDVLTQGGSAALSYGTRRWFASVVPSYNAQDARFPDRETDTRALTLVSGLTPVAWLSVSPSYAFARTRDFSTHTTVDTHVPTLTARLELLPGLVTFDTQSSYTTTVDNKDAVDSGILAGLARLTVSLKHVLPGAVAPALGLRVNYNRTTDDVVATNRREDYGVFLVFDLFAPVGLLPGPGLDAGLHGSRL